MVSFPTVLRLLVFTIHILRNSYKCCAIIIALFTMGVVIAMETECLCPVYPNITFARPKGVAISNQNGFKTPFMHTFSNRKKKLSLPWGACYLCSLSSNGKHVWLVFRRPWIPDFSTWIHFHSQHNTNIWIFCRIFPTPWYATAKWSVASSQKFPVSIFSGPMQWSWWIADNICLVSTSSGVHVSGMLICVNNQWTTSQNGCF